jgi:uncharacterized membrane-anchored protein YhcB (DUF1043 family)
MTSVLIFMFGFGLGIVAAVVVGTLMVRVLEDDRKQRSGQ